MRPTYRPGSSPAIAPGGVRSLRDLFEQKASASASLDDGRARSLFPSRSSTSTGCRPHARSSSQCQSECPSVECRLGQSSDKDDDDSIIIHNRACAALRLPSLRLDQSTAADPVTPSLASWTPAASSLRPSSSPMPTRSSIESDMSSPTPMPTPAPTFSDAGSVPSSSSVMSSPSPVSALVLADPAVTVKRMPSSGSIGTVGSLSRHLGRLCVSPSRVSAGTLDCDGRLDDGMIKTQHVDAVAPALELAIVDEHSDRVPVDQTPQPDHRSVSTSQTGPSLPDRPTGSVSGAQVRTRLSFASSLGRLNGHKSSTSTTVTLPATSSPGMPSPQPSFLAPTQASAARSKTTAKSVVGSPSTGLVARSSGSRAFSTSRKEAVARPTVIVQAGSVCGSSQLAPATLRLRTSGVGLGGGGGGNLGSAKSPMVMSRSLSLARAASMSGHSPMTRNGLGSAPVLVSASSPTAAPASTSTPNSASVADFDSRLARLMRPTASSAFRAAATMAARRHHHDLHASASKTLLRS